MKWLRVIVVFLAVHATAMAGEYVVKWGDTLSGISEKVYGDYTKWKGILKANPCLKGKAKNLKYGMKIRIPEGRKVKAGSNEPESVIVMAKVTAYEPGRVSCGSSADGITSTGKNAWIMNGVAADPRAVPYRTRVRIPGIGWKVVDDAGSAMRRSYRRGVIHFDVRMASVGDARKFGVRWLPVRIER